MTGAPEALPAPLGRSRWVLVLAASIAVFAALSPRDLWAPDEPRYGRIAYDMERGGDWLVSRWNGEFDAEKPPLGYWIMAAGGAVVGEVTPRAARLPCALLAVIAVLATAALGRRWFRDPALGDTAALLFATSGLVLWNSSRAGLDLPLTACELLAAWAATALVERPSVRAALGVGAALGAGILFKGPHALYVPLGAVLGGCFFAGRWRRLRDARWLLALGLMLVIVAAWLVPALLWSEPGYGERLLGQLASRLEGGHEPHQHVFPYLFGLILACGLPWTPVWVAGAVMAWRRRKDAPAEERFGLGAALGGGLVALLLLSMAASKRDVYLIPLLPCFALLGAWFLHRFPQAWFSRHGARWFALFLAGLAVAGFAMPLVIPHVLPHGPHEPLRAAQFTSGATPWVSAGLGLLVGVGAVLAFRRRHVPARAARVAGVALGLGWIGLALLLLPVFDDAFTWSSAVAPIRHASRDARLVQIGAPDALMVWGLRPSTIEMRPVGLEQAAATLDGLYAVGAPPVVAMLDLKWWDHARRQMPSLEKRISVLWARRVAHRTWAVLVRAPGGG